jgi:hypothetical protein
MKRAWRGGGVAAHPAIEPSYYFEAWSSIADARVWLYNQCMKILAFLWSDNRIDHL